MKKLNIFAKISSTILFLGMIVSCGNSNAVPEHTHEWDEGTITKEATCYSEGEKTYHCKFSGCQQTNVESIQKKEHTWDEGVITTQPTCHTEGVMTYTCQVAQCHATRTSTLPTTNHDFTGAGELVKVPDLLEDGILEKHCSYEGCDEVERSSVAAHADYLEQYSKYGTQYSSWQFGELDTFDPTDTTTSISFEPLVHDDVHGYYSYGGVIVDEAKVAVSDKYLMISYGFNFDRNDIDVNASIRFNGKENETRIKGYLVLVNKEGKVSGSEAIEATASIWEFETTTAIHLEKNCSLALFLYSVGTGEASGELEFTITAKCIHTWNDGVITVKPDCMHNGVKTYTCIKCEQTKEETLPKGGHDYHGVITKVPSLTEKGVTKFTCSICGDSYEEDIAPGKLNIPLTVNNTSARGDEVDSNRWIVDNVAHIEVSDVYEHYKEGDIWRGGLFVDTSIKFELGETYSLSYDLFNHREEDEISYQLCIQQGEFDHFVIAPVTLYQSEHVTQEFTVTTESTELFRLFFRFGNVVNELEISNLEIVKANSDPSVHNIALTDSNTIGRFDRGAKGNRWINDGKLHIQITETDYEDWPGGAFVNTGVAWKKGMSYKVEFDMFNHNTTKYYEACIQDGKFGDRFFVDPIRKTDENATISETFIANRDPLAGEEGSGYIWIFIRFGTQKNEVELSNLVIYEL